MAFYGYARADTSTINPLLPTTGSQITSSVLRGQFSSAYSDINNIYSQIDTLDSSKASVVFKTISVSGQDDVVADSTTDTLTFVAGSNMTITTSGDSITFAASGGGGSGDSVSIDSVEVTDPDFVSTGDVDFVDTSNTVTANLNNDVVAAAEMADADHGDVAWSGGVASVEDVSCTGCLTATDLGADSVSSSELNASGVESELEAVIDLSDLQGAVTDGQVPDDITIDAATLATTLTITDNESTSETNAVVFTAGGDLDGGNLGLESDGDLTYNPSTGTLASVVFSGSGASLTSLDGEQIQNDTIDDDSIDFGDVTFEDFSGSLITITEQANPTTNATGEIALDTDGWGTGYDALEIYNGTASAYIPAITASDTCTNGQVPKFNTGGEWTCENDGGGSSAALDLGDDDSDESAGITEIATSNDTNSIFTEPSADKFLINASNNWPTADTADALSANGANCSAGSAPLGVDASGAVESCTDYEEDLSDSSGLAAAISDETGTGSVVFATSATLTTPLISGKVDGDAGAVNDDDCTGEQGLFWYDDTDSAFEFCNANSGTPVTLSAGVSDGDKGDVVVSSSGAVWDIDSGVIVNADVNASAAIDATKIHDGSISNTEFGYLNGASSNLQTQISALGASSGTGTGSWQFGTGDSQGDYSISIGTESVSSPAESACQANNNTSVCIGAGRAGKVSSSSDEKAVMIGTGYVDCRHCVAIGNNTSMDEYSDNSVGVGDDMTFTSASKSFMTGNNSTITDSDNVINIGSFDGNVVNASNDNSIVIGDNVDVAANRGMVIGLGKDIQWGSSAGRAIVFNTSGDAVSASRPYFYVAGLSFRLTDLDAGTFNSSSLYEGVLFYDSAGHESDSAICIHDGTNRDCIDTDIQATVDAKADNLTVSSVNAGDYTIDADDCATGYIRFSSTADVRLILPTSVCSTNDWVTFTNTGTSILYASAGTGVSYDVPTGSGIQYSSADGCTGAGMAVKVGTDEWEIIAGETSC